jgi:MFS family permease
VSVSRNVRLLGWFNFLGDCRLYGPLVVIYFAQVTGSYGAATSLLALKMLSSAAFDVPTGVLSDRLGRRGTLTAGAVVMVAAHIGYASASGYGLLVGAVLEGLARSAFVSLRASGRVGAARTLLFGEVFANVASVVALVKPTGVSPALLTSEPLAYGTSTIAQQTLLQREFTDRERAMMGSLGSLLGSVLYALIAVGAGLAADHWGIVAALLASQAVGLAALPLVWWVHAHASRPPARP